MENEILRILRDAGEGASLKTLSERLGIPTETMHNILKVMEKKGYLEERRYIDGSLDYSIQQKGLDFLRKKQ